MPRRAPPRPGPNAPSAAQAAARIELARRARLPAAVEAVIAGLFGPQRDMVMSDARRIVSCAGRRGGKTWSLVARALRAAARYPGSTIPVFERTQTCAAARTFWKALLEIDGAYSLDCRFHNSLYLATLPNGSSIIIMGADTADAADKARGDAYPEAIIDEAGTFRPHILEYLIDDVLTAALFDYHGSVVMAGTPSVRPVGPFADACATSGVNPRIAAAWTQFHWTLFDNPHLPKDADAAGLDDAARAALRDERFRAEMAAKGLTLDAPYVQREYFGKWLLDHGHMAYVLGHTTHPYDGVVAPDDLHTHPDRYTWLLALDMGFNDPTAFVVLARDRVTRVLWVVESYERSKLIPSAVAAEAARIRSRWPALPSTIVADTGGYGKGPAAEMASARWGFTVVPAKKSPGYKETARNFLNGDLQAGRVRIVEAANRDLIHDAAALRLDPASGDEDGRDPNHLPDALLYGAMHMASVDRGLGERDAPAARSAAWYARMEADMEAAASRAARGGGADPTINALPEY